MISNGILQEMTKTFTSDDVLYAKSLMKQEQIDIRKVNYENEMQFEITGIVKDKQQKFQTYIDIEKNEIKSVTCTCDQYKKTYGTCIHILATLLEFHQNTKTYTDKTQGEIDSDGNRKVNIQNKARTFQDEKYKLYKQMVRAFYYDNISKNQIDGDSNTKLQEKIRLEPKLIYNKFNKELKVEVKIGNKKLYKIKDFSEFYNKILYEDVHKYGKSLEFIHKRENFRRVDLPLLEFILKYSEIMKYANQTSKHYGYSNNFLSNSYITVSNSGLDDLFDVLVGKTLEFQNDYVQSDVTLMKEEPKIEFEIEKGEKGDYKISPNVDIYGYDILQGSKYVYFLYQEKLYRLSNKFKDSVLKLLDIYRKNFTTEISFAKEDLTEFFSIVMPMIEDKIRFDKVNSEDLTKFIPKKLRVKLFLDYDENNYLTADVKFCYDDIEFNPFENVKMDITRNALKESEMLDILSSSGFVFDQNKKILLLIQEDKIYQFLQEELDKYLNIFDVLVTDSFKQKEIKQPKVSNVGVKVENNLLHIDLSDINFDRSEFQEMMQKYKLKKKFHRLKDGSFIDLEDNEWTDFWDELAVNSGIEYKDLEEGELTLPVYRTMYLDRLLKKTSGINIKEDESYQKIIDDIDNKKSENEILFPKALNATLRSYQQTGYRWLRTLDQYKLGGILADDMGLGKTIQLLAVVLSYVEENKEHKPSIVVCPSSLSLNWKNEAEMFTPSLKVQVISGNSDQREAKINHINDYDIIITSYDLLKRDIDLYKESKYDFKYIIADEAQYIKNNNTKNAKAIKQIQAEARFALTGTPIENSLSELWSIFDFIMPGYLFGYSKFKNQYELPIIREEDSQAMSKLKMLIEPFVLRRIKENVLKELPDKTISVLKNEMEEEQQKIYLSYMENAKKQANEEISMNGFENSQIKILALLMRLRQICCHPGLFIENYEEGSGKLNQCVEIIKDAVRGNHKILLFSGYSSMFSYIEKELKQEGINYFKLTGQTKIDDRMELVEEFNRNSDIKVFLISLKAGGTGLNLIGADMVIHYDPWWNISVENQATDRSYRIGQKKNVQVYKLITKNSIEEKIYDLQQKKAELIDNMLSTNETFINKLSKEDIMNLFE